MLHRLMGILIFLNINFENDEDCRSFVYWFCFENYFTKYDLGRFKGFIYQANSAEDIINGLIKVNENRFETLCFVSNNKTLQRRK